MHPVRARTIGLMAGCLLCLPASAQTFIQNPPGLDTSARVGSLCDSSVRYRHWSADVKYPVSSEVLVRRANAFLQKSIAVDTSVTGVIGFQFQVDCEGRASRFVCEQSTLRWEPVHFSDAVVMALYRFVLSLAPMPIGRYKYNGPMQGKVINYHTYFSFVIRDGKVQSVAP